MSNLHRSLQIRRYLQTGTVSALNTDGSYDVRIDGEASTFVRVFSPDRGRFQPGEQVTIGFMNGSRQQPLIVGGGGYHVPA